MKNWLLMIAIKFVRANGVRVIWPKPAPRKRVKKVAPAEEGEHGQP